ncbi:MAG: DNA topoisomerase VI subunit B [Acidobacteriota bacterium]|nr:DNA topoisomerase VI subunit B [Blastocatellia bacterium]MDW8239196.1 DNA topoisomerase VI subunit B [Acidobacteriota bacterium]
MKQANVTMRRAQARKAATAPLFDFMQPAEKEPAPESVIEQAVSVLPASPPAREKTASARRRETAQTLAQKQREISVSEFFLKNRHLLGFDNPQKALLTAVKEAVDNSLDACERAGILPEIAIEITQLGEERFRVAVQDNGPGIVRAQIPKVFGKLLYGSKFHTLLQQRGQQGIGISAAGMYGQLTTGKPVVITSRVAGRKDAHHFEIMMDTAKNEPKVLVDTTVGWDAPHGTRVEIELEGIYRKGARSVDQYVAQTAMANPHARIIYKPPKDDQIIYERAVNELPAEPIEIKPHPYGVELGALIKLLRETKARNLKSALQSDFSRVSAKVAEEICQQAGLEPSRRPSLMTPQEIEQLFRAIPRVKIMAPPTNCLSPIGEQQILAGLKHLNAEFYTALTRAPAVYRGNPFQIEVGLAYGGQLPSDQLVELMRFANRVPLLYQQSACATFKAALSVDWRSYGLSQSKGALPTGPCALFVHMASAWVPFTSESKEAIASYPEILREIRLALQECGRRLSMHIKRGRRLADEHRKRSYIERYLPVIGEALQNILDLSDQQRDAALIQLEDILERSRKL